LEDSAALAHTSNHPLLCSHQQHTEYGLAFKGDDGTRGVVWANW